MSDLPEKHRAFVDAYTTIGSDTYMNASRSCVAVGYAEGSASVQGARLLGNDKVKQEVGRQVKQNIIEAGIDKQQLLIAIADKAYNTDGMTSEAGQIKCLEMLAKYINLFEQSEQNLAPKILIQYANVNKQG